MKHEMVKIKFLLIYKLNEHEIILEYMFHFFSLLFFSFRGKIIKL